MKKVISLFAILTMLSLSVSAHAADELQDELTDAITKCLQSQATGDTGFGQSNANFDKGLYGLQVACNKEAAQNLMNAASKKLSYFDEAYDLTNTSTIRRVFDSKKRDFFCVFREDDANKRLPVCHIRLTLDSVIKQ